MRLLAIETSSEACSVALQVGEVITEQHRVEAREHTRILLPMIRQLLADQGLAATDLDAVVLGNGPGSFIGMRISASVAQGLCFGAGLPLVPISSLAAVAAEVIDTEAADKVAVAQDARMQEVYFGTFLADALRLPVLQDAETIVSVERPGLLQGTGWIAAGGGWLRYPQLEASCSGAVARISSVSHPRARYLLKPGASAFRQGKAIRAERLEPAYLRNKVAEPLAGRGP
ncbi:MAG TPA: tRNA (adenosine(37)-N6)-threonylcarbamoyltransferase complex dimerization subunit type 1 TsaB [Woeseiaceae bacterium]|nr:tRNA (adenosine(37)-N6)-threonylcarbamoyltransferase complex dimerization subunit type 1 TsaB [Woeseiaceae bacterium]